MSAEWEPWFLLPGAPLAFPDPRLAGDDGLVAFGGDLSPERLLLAYRSGIFPWFDEGVPPLWWSPNPRCVIPPGRLHVSRSLARTIRRGGFELSWNRAFGAVMQACADARADGTWIIPPMLDAYLRLHELGAAHSLEVWQDGELVGGLYGVQVGALFAAESKFHRRTDMSKVALVAAVRSVTAAGVQVFDVQFRTEHLARMGAIEIPRAEYLRRATEAAQHVVDLRALAPGAASDAEPTE